MEGIESSVLGITYVDDLATEIVGKLSILVLRIENEDLGVLCRHIYKQRLGSV